MLSTSLAPSPRELLIALPGVETDLYRIHQLVWDHVDGAVGRSMQPPSFIYRIDNGMIRVRSQAFASKGTVAAAFRATAPVFIDLAAVWGAKHDQGVPAGHLSEWCEEKLALSGLQTLSLTILDHETRIGMKKGQRIQIPVARICATVLVTDQDSFAQAWSHGIGRGKRFGLGMLAH